MGNRLTGGSATSDATSGTACTFLRPISVLTVKIHQDFSYTLAGVPRLTICATSVRRRAIPELIAGVTALSELGVVRGKMLIVIETLLKR